MSSVSGGGKVEVTNFPTTQPISSTDGAQAALGATSDAEAFGNGSVVAVLKRVRTLLSESQLGDLVTRIRNGGGASELTVNQAAKSDGNSDTFWSAATTAQLSGYTGPDVPGSGKWDRIRVAGITKNFPRTALAAAGVGTIWTPAAGRTPRVLWFSVTTSAATILTVKIGTQIIWERNFITGAPMGFDVLLPLNGWVGTAADQTVTVTTTAAATVGASAIGTEE